jgi:FkbM family methyltransferase
LGVPLGHGRRPSLATGLARLRDYVLSAIRLGPGPIDSWSIFWKETKNIRVRLGLEAHSPEHVYSLRTIYGPLYFRDNFGDITNLLGLFYHRVYSVTGLRREGVILDVGANIGLAAAWFAFHNPDRPIYCFEPLPTNVALIKLNCPGAHVEQVAIGGSPGRVKLEVDRDGVMATSVAWEHASRSLEFEVVPLDAFAQARGLERVALLKIDVEGMECDVLEGARGTLELTQQVAMETHSPALHARSIELLRGAGLTVDAERFSGSTGMLFASRFAGDRPAGS